MEFDRPKAVAKATAAYDQCLACIDEIMDRVPNAVMFAMREGGPTQSNGVVPTMRAGEWEVIRKFAQLGWSHYGLHTLGDSPEAPQ